jgi:hypothetical protein
MTDMNINYVTIYMYFLFECIDSFHNNNINNTFVYKQNVLNFRL